MANLNHWQPSKFIKDAKVSLIFILFFLRFSFLIKYFYGLYITKDPKHKQALECCLLKEKHHIFKFLFSVCWPNFCHYWLEIRAWTQTWPLTHSLDAPVLQTPINVQRDLNHVCQRIWLLLMQTDFQLHLVVYSQMF